MSPPGFPPPAGRARKKAAERNPAACCEAAKVPLAGGRQRFASWACINVSGLECPVNLAHVERRSGGGEIQEASGERFVHLPDQCSGFPDQFMAGADLL